jgi:hypothetical protein
MLDGEIFTTSIYNIGFNRAKFSHSDILQFKYDNNKALLAKLQEIFHKEYKYCIDARNAKHADDRTRTNIARAFDTSIVVYGTEESDLFVWEPLFENITLASEKEIRQMTEDEFETILNRTDPKAAIKQTTRLQKVRDLDTSIGDSLKRVYDYRCQMTGEIVGERYGVHTVEAHHILHFTLACCKLHQVQDIFLRAEVALDGGTLKASILQYLSGLLSIFKPIVCQHNVLTSRHTADNRLSDTACTH